MKEEILNLVQNAKNVINELENYLFTNHREFYIFSKAKIEAAKDSLQFIETELPNFDEQALQAAKVDLSDVVEKFKVENFGAKGEALDYTGPLPPQQTEFSKAELDNLLGALDNANFDDIITSTTEGITTLTTAEEVTTPLEDVTQNNNVDISSFETLPQDIEVREFPEVNFNEVVDASVMANGTTPMEIAQEVVEPAPVAFQAVDVNPFNA